jgi:hypothetical protein
MPFQRGEGPLPTKYNAETVRQAYTLVAIYGATDKMLADVLGVNVRTIQLWKNNHPEFNDIIQAGKIKANAKVANALYENCFDRFVWTEEERIIKGVKYVTRKQIFVQGDKWAQAKFLSIRSPELWSGSSHPSENNTTTNINVLNTGLSTLSIDEIKLLTNIAQKQLTDNVEPIE